MATLTSGTTNRLVFKRTQMRTFALLCAIVALAAPLVFGQVRIQGNRIYASANPEDSFQLFRLVSDKQVQLEVGLTNDQLSAYAKVIGRQNKELRSARREERAKVREQQRSDAMACMGEILTPKQRRRLKQLAYRIEIATIGLGEAVSRGYLSEALAVTEEQAPRLVSAALSAESDFRRHVRTVRISEESQLLEELTPEQHSAAKSALGEPWFYETYSESQLRIQHELKKEKEAKSGRTIADFPETRVVSGTSSKIGTDLVFVTGNPSFPPHVFRALKDRQVQDELELSADQIDSIAELTTLQKELSIGPNDMVRRIKERLDKILSPEQAVRVKELMYRVEIGNGGIGHSLTLGRLSLAIGLHVQQREPINRKAAELKSKAIIAINHAMQQRENQVFQLLAPEQQSKVDKLLGQVCNFETKSLTQEALSRKLRRVRDPALPP